MSLCFFCCNGRTRRKNQNVPEIRTRTRRRHGRWWRHLAERAEWFFKKHPQDCNELYNGYIALLDCCTKMEGKHKRHSSLISSSTATANYPDEEIIDTWDVESSLSYQRTPIKAVATLQGSSTNQLPSKQLLLFKEDVSFLPIHILVSIIEGFVTVFVC